MADSKFYGLLVLAAGRTAPPGILPELHLNLWEKSRLIFWEENFLDIGLMLDVNDTARTFEFVLPWAIKNSDLEDLSERILDKAAIPAVFNEMWRSTSSNGQAGYVTDPTTNNCLFTVVHVGNDLKVHTHSTGNATSQLSIQLDVQAIKAKSTAACAAAEKMYVRFRVKDVPSNFYRVSINPKDRIFLSSWQRTEIIDFRMNVRRGIPLGFDSNLKATFAEFSKVHLFLMKSRDQDIVFEDKWFRSCRSLEDEEFWASYSLAPRANSFSMFRSRHHVKNSLGYQWTRASQADAQKKSHEPIREFGALARFKKVRFGLISFILAAAIVGAVGNAVWDGIKLKYGQSTFATSLVNFVEQSSAEKGEQK